MARILTVTCDYCEALDMVPAEATETTSFTIDGDSHEWDLCDPHGHQFRQIRLVAARLREIRPQHDAGTITVQQRQEATEVSAPMAEESPGPPELPQQTQQRPELTHVSPEPEPPQAEATLFPSAPPPPPPLPPAKVYDDGKQRLRCMECPDHPVMLRGSASQHARLLHHKDLQETRFEGVGFRFKAPPRPGTRQRGVPSLICRESHATGSAYPYWVPEAMRASHARSSHPDKRNIADVDYENRNNIPFLVRCKAHPWCAQADGGLGYGFMNQHSLATHMMKERERANREAQALRENNQA